MFPFFLVWGKGVIRSRWGTSLGEDRKVSVGPPTFGLKRRVIGRREKKETGKTGDLKDPIVVIDKKGGWGRKTPEPGGRKGNGTGSKAG